MATTDEVKSAVREKYGQAARRVAGGAGGCCSPESSCCDPITANLYDAAQGGEVPADALAASLGCGNPTALAELKPGETVLDLGSGGGIDVLLSARRVGPTGKAFGLDMTDEMLALAEENRRRSGLANAHFLKGEIENIPLPDDSVDVSDREYLDKLAAAGFRDAAIEVTRVYRAADARELLAGQGADVEALASEVDGRLVAAFVRATKPAV